RRRFVVVAEYEVHKLESSEVARDEDLRIAKTPDEPAEGKAVCPEGDARLVAAQKGDRRPDAVDPWRIVELSLEVQAELLLNTAADTDEDVRRPPSFDDREQVGILHGATPWVIRREVAVVGTDR